MMIRPVSDSDTPIIANITISARLAAYAPLLPLNQRAAFYQSNTPERVESMVRRKIDRQDEYIAYVYEHDGEVWGYIVANLRTGAIPFLFVRHDQHGKGIGKALFDHLVSETSTSQCYVVVLEANTTACQFYISRGFSVVGEKEKTYFGLRRVIMQWKR